MSDIRWRVLAILLGPPVQVYSGTDQVVIDPLVELQNGVPFIQTQILRQPTLADCRAAMQMHKPNLVYYQGAIQPNNNLKAAIISEPQPPTDNKDGGNAALPITSEQVASLVKEQDGQEHGVHAVILDIKSADNKSGLSFHAKGVPFLIRWPECEALPALPVLSFTQQFMSMLRNPTVTIPEAFTIASHIVQVHVTGMSGQLYDSVILPELWGNEKPDLPNASTIPPPNVPGQDFRQGMQKAVPGWELIRLLAPRAEVRLKLVGHVPVIEASRLGYLGQSVRALLAVEVRDLTLESIKLLDYKPHHLPTQSFPAQAVVRTQCGVRASVVIGAPKRILASNALMEHALRQTMMADALSLQFRLPPPNVKLPQARSEPNTAYGAPVIDTLCVTSLWVVHVLQQMSKVPNYRGLVSLGIASVGGSSTKAFTQSDAVRFSTAVSGMQNAQLDYVSTAPQPRSDAPGVTGTTESLVGTGAPKDIDGQTGGAFKSFLQLSTTTPLSWSTSRPALSECSKQEFISDLVKYLQAAGCQTISADTFPEVMFNGSQLDLFNLYKQVVARGGWTYEAVINWKDSVYPELSNFDPKETTNTNIGTLLK